MEESMTELVRLCRGTKRLLMYKLKDMRCYGTDCICPGKNRISTVEEGSNPPKAITYCLDCGGFIR